MILSADASVHRPAPDLRLSAPAVLVLDSFRLLTSAAAQRLSLGTQRLVAFLALRGGPVSRDLVAGTMWPAVSEVRAHASLRAALTRLGRGAGAFVEADAINVCLARGVAVDLHLAQRIARRTIEVSDRDEPHGAPAVISTLSAPLLPGWYDDWVVAEAESWRQLRVHALEALARSLAAAHRFADAASAAGAAVTVDPLRESAQAALIGVHLAEGNQSEAVRAFERYRDLLGRQLGLEPTTRLRNLLPATRSR